MPSCRRRVPSSLAVRAGGNPFFLEEALRDLVERGALERENGRLSSPWSRRARDPRRSCRARSRRASTGSTRDARELIGVAAVVGRSFGLPLMERLVPRERLLPALSELQRLELVRRGAPPARARVPLPPRPRPGGGVREPGRAAAHCSSVGKALGDRATRSSPADVYGLLARHFAEADEPEKAAEYLLAAGDAARALYADQEALDHYRRARIFLARLGDERRARDTLFKMALAHHLAFDFERAEDAYDEAFCCRVATAERLLRTERVETALGFKVGPLFPGESYTTEGMTLLEHLFQGLLSVDRELNVLPEMADNFRVSSDGPDVPLPAPRGHALERRRARDGRRLRLRLEPHARGGSDHGVPARGRRGGGGARRPDARGSRARAEQRLPLHPRLRLVVPLATALLRGLGDAWREPENLVGNGPFVLAERYTDEHAVLRANPHWLGPRGNVAEVHVTLGLRTGDLLEAWREGRFDLAEVYDLAALDCEDTLGEIVSGYATEYVAYQATTAPFSNDLVRKAFSHALDRSTVLPPEVAGSGRGPRRRDPARDARALAPRCP